MASLNPFFDKYTQAKQQLDEANAQLNTKTTKDFLPNLAPIQIQRPNSNAIERRYGAMKEQAGQRIGAATNDAADAIKRRFASQGASGSGAEIKAMERLNDQGVRQKEDALNQIGAEEANTTFQNDLQGGMAQADMDFKNRVFNYDTGSKMHELDLAERQQKIDEKDNEFNKRLAMEMSQPKGGFISNLLGGIL